jgi:uncharacterized protein (DUF433 family)
MADEPRGAQPEKVISFPVGVCVPKEDQEQKKGDQEMPVQERPTPNKLPEFPSVVSTPNVCGGSPRLIRTRIPLWVLERMRQLGFSETKILESFPTLTSGDLVQAWGYIAIHKTEIEKEIEENEQDEQDEQD